MTDLEIMGKCGGCEYCYYAKYTKEYNCYSTGIAGAVDPERDYCSRFTPKSIVEGDNNER